MKIGILSLQGDFEAHGHVLRCLGAKPVNIRHVKQLASIRGLILPGGESTTMLKLLEREKFIAPLIKFSEQSPILGTCAGAILMAKKVSSPKQQSLGMIDMTIERNAYGRHIDSSIQSINPEEKFVLQTAPGPIEAIFIRAPKIKHIGKKVVVLAAYENTPVLVEQNHFIAATFHPELTNEQRVHALFLDRVCLTP